MAVDVAASGLELTPFSAIYGKKPSKFECCWQPDGKAPCPRQRQRVVLLGWNLVSEAHFGTQVLHVGSQVRIVLDESCASVPAQNGIIFFRGTDLSGLLVELHCLAQTTADEGARPLGAVLRFGPPLANDPLIIDSIIRFFEARKQCSGPGKGFGRAMLEGVGDGEKQGEQRLLVLGLNHENVFTDALGIFRFVEESVPFGLGESSRHRFRSDPLELEHVPSCAKAGYFAAVVSLPPRSCLQSLVRGSQCCPTTLSLRRIM